MTAVDEKGARVNSDSSPSSVGMFLVSNSEENLLPAPLANFGFSAMADSGLGSLSALPNYFYVERPQPSAPDGGKKKLRPAFSRGYRKYFIIGIDEKDFETRIRSAYGNPKEGGMPRGGRRGYLGAMWIADAKFDEILGAAVNHCGGDCSEDGVCRQVGCHCSDALGVCIG